MNTAARNDLCAVALAYQAEIEALYRRMLADLPERATPSPWTTYRTPTLSPC